MINNGSALILYMNSCNNSSALLEISLSLGDLILLVLSLDLQPHLLDLLGSFSHLEHEVVHFVPFFAGFELLLDQHVLLQDLVGLFGV